MLLIAAAALLVVGIIFGPATAAIGILACLCVLLDASKRRLRDIDQAYWEGVADGRSEAQNPR